MAEVVYPLAEAAADLKAAGLFAYALIADGHAWRAATSDQLVGTVRGATLDSRQAAPDRLFVALRGERANGRDFVPDALAAGAHALTAARGSAQDDPLRAVPPPPRGVVLASPWPREAFAVLARNWRRRLADLVMVGVTGSNGKTTTKDLLAAALSGSGLPVHATRRNFNNLLGVPLTVFDLEPDHRFAVVEMGASAQGEIERLAAVALPRVGVITNAAPAHLAEFGSLEGVIAGKGELLDALPADGVAILNTDSPGFATWSVRARCRVLSWGRAAGDHLWSWQPPDRLRLDESEWTVPLLGEHNAANLTGAILAARAAGLDDAEIRSGLARFAASPHRGRVVRLAGRVILDDAYNANPDSMVAAAAALLSLPGGVSWAVLGAMAELGPDSEQLHRECGRQLARTGLDRLLAVGDGAEALAAGFDADGGRAETCATCAAAAERLLAEAAAGHRILIKGSRAAAMERVLDTLAEHWAAADSGE